ncbi:phosphoethanolamine transferase [Helicobacter cynogastricus]|uniref:phosphoethanolamine transferase n=1 Tax=Helicobacter cynogastricus TaxID=329937 RepID=UPI001F3BA1F1|nr:phosphoethanolamine transferase [Helicobacter cynogastricus]
MIAVFANTLEVFKTLLNYGDVENKAIPWYQQKTLGAIFKLAGYKTFWPDNQEVLSTNNYYSAFAYGFTYKFSTHETWNSGLAHYDQWLIPLFEQQVQPKIGAKNLILIHLFGNHPDYKGRFPKSFAKFTPGQIRYQSLHIQNDRDKQVVADYVNSLYYTDHILEEFFKFFKDKDALILYFSDHAQDVFETNNGYGHRCSTYGVEIPFVIYVTDLFKQKHPEKVKLIAQAVHKPFMSDDLIHVLLPLTGIHTKDYMASKDLLSLQFDTHRKRIYCEGHLYNKP